MGAAALPIGMIAGQVGGSVLSANAAKPKNVAVPPPNPLFPGMQQSYMRDLTASGIQPQSFGTIAEAARTGLPVDQGQFFDSLKASMGRGLDQGRANLIEKFGVQGLRHSSPMMGAAVDYESQVNKDFATIMADYTRQAQESAMGRRMQASMFGIGAAGEPGLAMTPSSTLVTGSPSTLGSGLSAGGSGLQQILMLRALFPDLFSTAPKGT